LSMLRRKPSTSATKVKPHQPTRSTVSTGEVERRLMMRNRCRVRFVQGLCVLPESEQSVEGVRKELDNMRTSLLDDVTDDMCTDKMHFEQCMDFLQDFAASRQPPRHLVDKVSSNAT
jgi:hypothetical protein